MKQAILVDQNITEPKTLPANLSDAAITPPIMEGENVIIEEEMSVEEDKFGGVILTVKKAMDSASFASNLGDSISHWKQQAGFRYHHAEPNYLKLVYWIPDTSFSLPANASHHVDVGAFVFNEKKITPLVRLQKCPLPAISRKDLKKAKFKRKALKRMLCGSMLDMQDTDDDGQLGNSSHGRNEEDRVNNELRITGRITPGISFGGKDNNYEDSKVFDPLIGDKKHETWNKKLHGICSILAVMSTLLWGNRETTNNLLPVSSNDSANAPLLEQNALTFTGFLGSALHIPLQQRVIILTVFCGILRHVIQNPINIPPYEFQGGITTNTPQSVLSLDEAIFVFSHEIAYISLFITAYIMSWTLIMGLPSGLLIFLAVLLTFAPFLLLPHLLRNASATGVHVACGGFNLPANGFTVVATFGFCLFFVLVVLLVLYTIWSLMYRKTPAASGQDVEVTDSLFAGFDIED